MPSFFTQQQPAQNAPITVQVPTRQVPDGKIAYEVLRYIPEESAAHYRIAPLAVEDGVLEVGMTDPDSIQGVDALNFISRATGMPFKVFRISEQDLERVLAMYRQLGGEVDRAVTDFASEQLRDKTPAQQTEEAPLDLDAPVQKIGDSGMPKLQEDAPAIKLVSTILRYAIDGR